MDFLANIRRTKDGNVVSTKDGKIKLPDAEGKLETLNLAKLSQEELIQLVKDIVFDWNTLNDLHNGRATDEGWCSTYESNQAKYNTKFRRMRLRGRKGAVTTNPSAGDRYARGARDSHRQMYDPYRIAVTYRDPYGVDRYGGDPYGSNRRTL